MLLLVACSPKKEQADGSREFTGNLVALYTNLLNNPDNNLSEKCDISLKDSRLEIARQLEKRRSEIQQIKSQTFSETKEDGYPILKLGSMSFYNNLKVSAAANSWEKESSHGWYDIIRNYESIKNDPTNSKWVLLDKIVRGRATDDYDRIHYWANYNIGYSDEEKIRITLQIAGSCMAEATCKYLDLPSDLYSWAQNVPLYQWYLEKIRDDSTSKFKSYLKRFHTRLSNDLSYKFSPRNRNHKVDKESSTIYVHLDMSALGKDPSPMIKILEEAWSQYGLTVKILTYREAGYSYYKFVHEFGQVRAYVSTNPNVIALPPFSFVKTVIHEVGHVLGLRDEYFTNWSEETCGYADEFNAGNIMSKSSTGQVLPNHIETIKSIYFN